MVLEGGYAYTDALEGIPFTLGPAAYGSFRECLLPEGRSPSMNTRAKPPERAFERKHRL